MTYIEYRPGEKYAAPNADTSEFHESFQDCGLLLSPTDIVVDIDHLDKEVIKEMISTFNLDTMTVWTERGCHLYFEKPYKSFRRKDGVCQLAFEIEQHTASNRPQGLTIKRNGTMRSIDNYGKRMVLPEIFRVGTKSNGYIDLNGMEEGDGRNKGLFTLKNQLRKKQCKIIDKILSFVNTFIFAEPLDENEFNTVSRATEGGDGEQDEEFNVSTEIISDLRTNVWASKIWFWSDGHYVSDANNSRFEREVYSRCYGKKTRFVKEVIEQVELRSPYHNAGESFPIRFKNGILMDGKWTRIPEYTEFTPYYIDIDYLPTAEPVPIVDAYLDNLTGGEQEYRQLLLEALATPLITSAEKTRELSKFFMLRGDGANGKGTMLQIMARIYNVANCSFLSIKQLSDPTMFITIAGKLVNLGDDVEPDAIDNKSMKVIKNITSADIMEGRYLYKQSEMICPTAKLFFTTNSDIRSWEKNYAYKRRVLWLPMFNTVTKPDPKFISKITTREALEYWISLIVEGYFRLYDSPIVKQLAELEHKPLLPKKGLFTYSPKVYAYCKRYHENNNPMMMFAKDMGEEALYRHSSKEIRIMFDDWTDGEFRWQPKLFRQAVWELWEMGYGIHAGTRILLKQKDTMQDIRP